MKQLVTVLERKFGCFPASFAFCPAGPVLAVDAVERCWTELSRHRHRPKYHYRVRCGSERYRLSEDGASGEWFACPEIEAAVQG